MINGLFQFALIDLETPRLIFFVYNFYPFIALEHYKKILGDAFYYDEDTDILMPEEDGGLYDIAEFINYGIRITRKIYCRAILICFL